jgi:hypothetical protein
MHLMLQCGIRYENTTTGMPVMHWDRRNYIITSIKIVPDCYHNTTTL